MLRYGVVVIKLFILLPLLMLKTANAAPMGYPEVPHFGYQTDYQAVWNLFDGQVDEIRRQEAGHLGSDKSKKVFIVRQAGQNWFVKTVPLDLNNHPLVHFEYEWELKAQLAGNNPLAAVRGEIIFADRAAFFTNKMQQYYVARYPLVPGKTIRALADQYMSTKSSVDFDILEAAVFRYAQVSAYLHFDPDDPPNEGEDILERPIRFFLEDRNSTNEIYDPATDTVYLIDYSPLHSNHNKSIPVKNYLARSYHVAVGGIPNDGDSLNYLTRAFIYGYACTLPQYNNVDLLEIVLGYLENLTESQIKKQQQLNNQY